MTRWFWALALMFSLTAMGCGGNENTDPPEGVEDVEEDDLDLDIDTGTATDDGGGDADGDDSGDDSGS